MNKKITVIFLITIDFYNIPSNALFYKAIAERLFSIKDFI
ncbi:MAG: hypothetical protein AVDCRST_MAG96-31 [uncultured Segetibacter sp.]|uniref:Uncharacterized protein n=1 Tax=uncultured Segetibacter sp. TaxID=481133 RepID=A0A6J4R770_9BACT|nr:MAG: hypothetical protein AVDCRST_MAG96-31 [uncultured Segetibacter sp.]